MAFRFIGKDWWTERGWLPAPDHGSSLSASLKCVVCGSSYNLAMHPEKIIAICEFHSKCTDDGLTMLLTLVASGAKLTVSQWKILSLNSYDRDSLIPHLSDEVLIWNVELTLKNCSRFDHPAGTYDQALQLYAEEMVKRLKSNKESNVSEGNQVSGL